MNTNPQTAVTIGNEKESRMNVNPSTLIRWSGLAAVVAGIIFAGIQPIHPGTWLHPSAPPPGTSSLP